MSGDESSGNEASDDDVLRLNVGGEKMHVLRRTLTVCGGVLGAKFSGRWDSTLPRDSDGFILLEHDPQVFGVLVAFLREKVMETPLAPLAPHPPFTGALCRLLEYYGLTMAVCPVVCCREKPTARADYRPPHTAPEILQGTELRMQESECYYFLNRGKHHERVPFHSFEIELTQVGPGKKAEIGWFSPYDCRAILDCASGKLICRSFDRNGEKGCEDMLLQDYGRPFPTNVCIRSEDRGAKWFIDGRLWCDVNNLNLEKNLEENLRGDAYPCFAVEGTCKIVSFGYEFPN